jgi:hypothetical protein
MTYSDLKPLIEEQSLLGRWCGFIHFEAIDLKPSCDPGGARKVVVKLETKPDFRCAAERLGETDSHFRRDPCPLVEKIVKRLPRSTQVLRGGCHSEIQQFKALLSNDSAGMQRGFHTHDVLILMMVHEINVNGMAIYKPEDHG